MPIDTRTPEAAHSDLVAAIEYELDRYGPSSLAEIAAVLCEARIRDEDNPAPADAYWADMAARFHRLAEETATVREPDRA